MAMRSQNLLGGEVVKVRVRQMRLPEIGDKFSSRHGQKGVCGMLYRQEDLPFTRDGMVPDIIMNPHAMPSRMTIGQLMECLLGKVSAIRAFEGDATPFEDVHAQDIGDQLQESGFERTGNEVFSNGRSGKRLFAKLFYGPTFYQRLKHLVSDKMHARARGPLTQLLRQPVEGRSRNGGLRFGEMERDCLIAHGAASMLRDRLCVNSDIYRTAVCETCGMLAIHADSGEMSCRSCKERARFGIVEVPYAFKLLCQELISMMIWPRWAIAHEDV